MQMHRVQDIASLGMRAEHGCCTFLPRHCVARVRQQLQLFPFSWGAVRSTNTKHIEADPHRWPRGACTGKRLVSLYALVYLLWYQRRRLTEFLSGLERVTRIYSFYQLCECLRDCDRATFWQTQHSIAFARSSRPLDFGYWYSSVQF